MRPDPCPVVVDGKKPMLCVCGVCGMTLANSSSAKYGHMRDRCMMNGLTVLYFHERGYARVNADSRRKHPDFRRVSEPEFKLPQVIF